MAPACAQRAVDAPAVHARHVVRAQRQMEREIEKAINVYVFALAGVNFYAGGE